MNHQSVVYNLDWFFIFQALEAVVVEAAVVVEEEEEEEEEEVRLIMFSFATTLLHELYKCYFSLRRCFVLYCIVLYCTVLCCIFYTLVYFTLLALLYFALPFFYFILLYYTIGSQKSAITPIAGCKYPALLHSLRPG